MKKYIVVLVFISLAGFALAQTQKQWLKHAEKSYEEKDYYGASLYFREAMKADSSNLYVVYRYAESLRLFHNYKKAEHYYKYVWQRDKNRTYSESIFWMAMMQKNNAKYAEARKNFQSYSKSTKDKNSYSYKKSIQEIKSCEYALEAIKKPVKSKIYNLGDSLNSVNAEFAAVYVNDSLIYFTSQDFNLITLDNSVKDKILTTSIYTAVKIDSVWRRKGKIDSIANASQFNNANGSFSSDHNKFYFSRCDEQSVCQIFVSEKKDGVFQSAAALEEIINVPGTSSTQPFITTIDSSVVLFFASNRSGGQGMYDIWYSLWKDGKFSEPVNAGPSVNSIEDDICPFYDTSASLLFFSSPWHYGLGGFDVFGSPGKLDSFGIALNIGYPLNSSANDFYFSYNDSTLSGFFTSNRKGTKTSKENETCCNDLWSYTILKEEPKPDTTLIVKKENPVEDLQKYLPIKLYFHNDEPNPRTKDTITNLNYLETYIAYKNLIPVYKENYSKGLSPEKKQAAEDTIQSFFDHEADANVKMLDEFAGVLLKQLNKGYKLDVTVKGHASSLANTNYNVHLTLRRISSLENYLRAYGNGEFVPYLEDTARNGGHLKITKVPFGEYKADTYLSDNLNDKKNSVYSISAAIHRNIEIVSVSLEHKDSLVARMSFRKEVFDFGPVKAGHTSTHVFKFKNIGQGTLTILGIESTCACISAKASATSVPPAERGEVEVVFDSTGMSGKTVQSITLITNGIPERKELSITAEVK